ncbi:MAG: hypothetical protein ABSG28_04215 [Methanoregula sp.]|jgi:hypothetical protein|uniref:hypothetical protein n=1 Tax=Methanoregula sp. TaxID=2052170 RepID=UPI003C1DDC29
MVTDASPEEEEDAAATGVTGAGITIVVAVGGMGVVDIVDGTVCDGEAVDDDEEDKHPAIKIAAIRMRVTPTPGTRYLRAYISCTQSCEYINML